MSNRRNKDACHPSERSPVIDIQSAQGSATAVSLHVSWTLVKDERPFTAAKLIKKCGVDMAIKSDASRTPED